MAKGTLVTTGRLATWMLLCGMIGIIGCGTEDAYPVTLQYPVRSDLMLKAIPKVQPTRFNYPGQLPLDFLATLPTRIDPSQQARVIDYATVDLRVKNGSLKLDDNEKGLLEESKSNILDPRNLHPAEKAKIGEVLQQLFGTPAAPIVKVKSDKEPMGVAPEVVSGLQLDPATLKDGSRLYRKHCLHCHGLEGNGRGPTGAWVNPHPRDYRQGVFKFTSSTQDLGERKPRRDDLMHVLVHGIEGSSMPSFAMYDRADLDKIVSYVIHLSLRGDVEFFVMSQWLQSPSKLVNPPTAEEIEATRASMIAEGKKADEVQSAINEIKEKMKAPTEDQIKEALAALSGSFGEAVDGFSSRWVAAQSAAITPDPYPYPDTEEAFLESASRGATLFTTGTASCVSCHKNYGREAPYYFDAWGTVVRPRNLVDGYYRGGRRPIDMYYRVWSGINGAGMASYDKELRPNDQDKAKKVDKIWDLVNFMQALHYPDLRAKLKAKYGISVD
ncbi:MAG: cytochrome c [Gemmataceae bacterium]|nr:cytochrome c [Gemmataceae bacterium]